MVEVVEEDDQSQTNDTNKRRGQNFTEYNLEIIVTAGENSPPIFDNLDFEMAFSYPPIDPESIVGIPFPHTIQLGTVTDPEEDQYMVWFDNGGNDFIQFDELLMVILIDPTADAGTYNCTVLLTDLNAYQPLTSEYKFEITLGEVASEEETAGGGDADEA